MAATDLNPSGHARHRSHAQRWARRRPARDLAAALGAVWLVTALSVPAGLVAPGLAGHRLPHPVLRGDIGEVLWILAANLRLFAVPFALVALGFQRGRTGRAFGDLLVGFLVVVNAGRVGVALGRFGLELFPYVPQLPVEWLALALSASAWTTARRGGRRHELRVRAVQTLAAASIAAAVEVFLTPRAR